MNFCTSSINLFAFFGGFALSIIKIIIKVPLGEKMSIFGYLLKTKGDDTYILIRILVGCVFLSEGLQKFITPEKTGVGRFEKIGFSNPEFLANFVGSFEIMCGLLVLLGLFTRLAVIPLIIIMLTAITTTKIPILLTSGFWEMAHAARTDFSMLICSIFLLIVGAGRVSFDFYFSANKGE